MKNLFRNISIGSILSAAGSYLVAHIDPAIVHSPVTVAVVGAVSAVVGALTHHHGQTPRL